MAAPALNIGIVAGETSGDLLGARLVADLRRSWPDMTVTGIGGPLMREAGVNTLYDMDTISVMGLDDLVGRIFKILSIRRRVQAHFLDTGIDLFIGVDVPDFNLVLERHLKASGITTVHYVSPTVWAWRSYRVRSIARSVCHMMTLFPFEVEIYRRAGVPVDFVGHPLATEILAVPGRDECRARLGLETGATCVAVLPGSRRSEITRLAPVMFDAVARIRQQRPGSLFLVPAVDPAAAQLIRSQPGYERISPAVRLFEGRSREVLRGADCALVASGTAALESVLLATPTVVTYKVSALSASMVRLFSNVEHYSMPNHLLDEPLVPEFMQERATAGNLADAVLAYLDDPAGCAQLRLAFSELAGRLVETATRSPGNVVRGILDA